MGEKVEEEDTTKKLKMQTMCSTMIFLLNWAQGADRDLCTFIKLFFKRTIYLSPPEFLWESCRGLSKELKPGGKGCLVPAPLHPRVVEPEAESTPLSTLW